MSPLLIASIANQARVTAHFANYVLTAWQAGIDTVEIVLGYHRSCGELLHESSACAVLNAWRLLRPEFRA